MQISDDLFLGPASAPGPNQLYAPGNPAPMERGVGPMGRVFLWDVVPLTLQAAGLATSQNPASGASFSLVAGTGVTSRTRADGAIEYILDVPRNVTITAAGANTAQYRVTGYDVYGQLMSEDLAAPSTSTVQGNKAFRSIISVANRNATAGTNGITVGFGDKLGLPVRAIDAGYMVSVKWAGVITQDGGTFTAADTTATATRTTGDVRGTYLPSSASNGARRLVALIGVPAIGSGPQATSIGAFGVTQA